MNGTDEDSDSSSHRGFVQNLDGVLVGDVPLAESFLQRPERESLPLPEHDQVDVTEGRRGGITRARHTRLHLGNTSRNAAA